MGPLEAARGKERQFSFYGKLGGGNKKDSPRLVDFMKDFQARNRLDHGYYLGFLSALRLGNDPKMTSWFAWTVYPVPKQLVDDLGEIEVRPVNVVVSITDDADKVLADTVIRLEEAQSIRGVRDLFHRHEQHKLGTVCLVAPFPWMKKSPAAVVRPDAYTVRLAVHPGDVKKIAKVVVHLE